VSVSFALTLVVFFFLLPFFEFDIHATRQKIMRERRQEY